jgi:menaquinol-cytochrome c reductase iron-sulfur subunit
MSDSSPPTQTSSDAPPPTKERRGFIAVLAAGVGLVAGLIPAIAGAVTFLDPVIRREKKFVDPNKPEGQKTEDGYIRVASADALPSDGRPLRVQVRDDVTNKWTFTPDEPIGEVFLIQNKPGGEVTAFTTVCPHLGCSISLGTDADGKQIFKCPCHNSSFELRGTMIAEGNPSPRDMDTLEARVENGEVYVKYQNFHTGRATKQAKH